jgi:hypothetical protein
MIDGDMIGKDVFVRMVQSASEDFIVHEREQAISTSPLLAESTAIIIVHTDLRSAEELAWAEDLRAKKRAIIVRIDATDAARAARGWKPGLITRPFPSLSSMPLTHCLTV